MTEDLIFDVGMNHGEDTAHYLSKGFRVVAVEANPKLVEECRNKFSDAVSDNRLAIEPFGIAERSGEAKFWINEKNDDFSAFHKEVGSRGGKCHPVTVQCITFKHLLRKHGVPYYLKIDIERADKCCLESLDSADLPKYVSIEAHELEYLIILRNLGYRHFKVVDQMRHNSAWPQFSNENLVSRSLKRAAWYGDRIKNKVERVRYAPGSSGPFGEETAGEWLNLETVAYNWLHFHRGYKKRGNLNPRSWYDFHAKL